MDGRFTVIAIRTPSKFEEGNRCRVIINSIRDQSGTGGEHIKLPQCEETSDQIRTDFGTPTECAMEIT